MRNSDNCRSTPPTKDDPLRDALGSIVAHDQQKIALGEMGLLEAEDSPVEAVHTRALFDILNIGRRLPDLILNDERFPGTKVRMVRKLGGAFGFYPYFVGVPLVRRVLRTGDPNDAISWLQKVRKRLGLTVNASWHYNAAIIKGVYKVRSQMVHTGQVKSGQNRSDPSAIIDRALAICIQLVKIIIQRGAIPDWKTFDIT